jgi:hypothetical protein
MLGAVIPFTLLVILPTNKLLMSPALEKRSAHAGQLLARWMLGKGTQKGTPGCRRSPIPSLLSIENVCAQSAFIA